MFSKPSIAALLLCVSLVLVSCGKIPDSNRNPVVRIKNGKVRGRQDTTVGQRVTYYAFQGIPYAEPPTGNLRFARPVPKHNWNGILDATQDGDICIQNTNPVEGSEDCLFINVYTPKITTKHSELLPTMVFIHGGGFEGGSSAYSLYGPDYLLEKDVVVVSFNYRLGILGFLATGDTASPGNNGLKDQVLALKWVQDNVKNFGGDPNKVTVFGQSAGAASIAYHLLSPKSKGLFHAAIMESGTSLNSWTFAKHNKDASKDVAKRLTVDLGSTNNIVRGLRNVEAKTLQVEASKAALASYLLHDPRSGFVFGPVSEPEHEDAFFTGKSHERFSRGNFTKVPCIVGFNSLEGTFQFQTLFRIFLLKFDLFPAQLTPEQMNVDALKRLQLGLRIKQHYFGMKPVAFSDVQLMQYISDDQFVRPARELVNQLSKHNVDTFYYRFSYEGNLWGITNRTTPGVTHSEELGYIFRSNYTASPEDETTRARMTTMWTNFAWTKSPTPSRNLVLQNVMWRKSGVNYDYLDIGVNLEMKKNPGENMKFWDDIYESDGQPPFDTY